MDNWRWIWENVNNLPDRAESPEYSSPPCFVSKDHGYIWDPGKIENVRWSVLNNNAISVSRFEMRMRLQINLSEETDQILFAAIAILKHTLRITQTVTKMMLFSFFLSRFEAFKYIGLILYERTLLISYSLSNICALFAEYWISIFQF